MSSHTNSFSISEILANKDIPWDLESLSSKLDLTLDIIKSNPDIQWNYDVLSTNPSIVWESLNKGDFTYIRDLSYFYLPIEKLNIDTFMKYKNQNLNWHELLKAKIISFEELEKLGQELGIELSLFASFKYILKNLNDRDWNWWLISEREFINIELILKYPNLPWNWTQINSHSNITFTDFLNYPQLPWDMDYFSSNSNITLDIIYDNPDINWNFSTISQRRFIYDNIEYDISICKDIKWRQSQLQKLFVNFSPFCEDLDYFFRKWVNWE